MEGGRCAVPSAAVAKLMVKFASTWAAFHPAGPPIAHLLRQKESERCVRFHSLPFSKRYATSKRENWIVLDRANKLASRILGENSRCWLVLAQAENPDIANDHEDDEEIGDYGLSFEFKHFSPEDECVYRIFAKSTIWSAGSFNNLIARRANDTLHLAAMWVSADSGAVFAPYDGGNDLFLPTPNDVVDLKNEFSDWLSAHPEGL